MKKEAFNFSMVPNIPANAEFHFYYDDKITCKRIGKTEKVRYNYGEHSLSSAAQAAYEKVYSEKDFRNLAGPKYWLYEGKSLNTWRVENEQKKIDKIADEHTSSLISTEKVVNFIENYPVSSLKNWGDKFYGYPEEILKKMWGMVEGSEDEKPKKKICVLDDFGLQAHRFLIEKGVSPENIYFCISKDDESFLKIVKAVYSKLANSEKICSIFSLANVFGDNKMFDLIIANPPYGSHSSIAKQINKCLIGKFPSVIEVCQPSGFEDFYEYAINVGEGAAFDDAGVFTMVAAFKENKVNKYKSDMDFRLSVDEKEHEFYKTVTDYNRSHKSCFEFIEGVWENLDKIKNKDLFFAVGFFTPCANTRVGCLAKPKGAAEFFNLKKPVEKIWGGFQFENNTCLKNFFNFWYGISNGRENGWISIVDQKGSMIDMILKCLERAGGSTPGMKKYKKLFPNLDWSRSWTDKEILKELGLPEDFLEKEDE